MTQTIKPASYDAVTDSTPLSFPIIDLHCDALMKLSEAKGKLSFTDGESLDINLKKLKIGNVKLQAFAIFVYPSMPSNNQFQEVLDQIHYFYTEVLAKHPEMKLIRKWSELSELKEGEIGAILTLEGVDPIGNDLHKLTILYQLGVRSIGLTWNSGNLAADGVAEARGAGLSRFGKQIVEWCNHHQVFVDVSHLHPSGFWDVMKLAQYPIASHSNSKVICNHRRNLDDAQIKAMIERNAMIHIVFCPAFVKEGGKATIANLIQHIDHIVTLGGQKNIGLGSDFDGIESKVEQLEDASMYNNLIAALQQRYSNTEIADFTHRNFENYCLRIQ
ncbi:diguanylate cyclase [Ignatzschineria ureiclastica]|uniref:Diguanylate cyclase n=1 Tax=Ignatzschineria ureiclastica TaxID=472582 RepID=A0A2U2AFB8_9GAMM|nr:dipeptidase [Ignatzschineria ureiclastica]PWD81269.1 diguanylate cyclase [Ignatzschineria ureiclastica]